MMYRTYLQIRLLLESPTAGAWGASPNSRPRRSTSVARDYRPIPQSEARYGFWLRSLIACSHHNTLKFRDDMFRSPYQRPAHSSGNHLARNDRLRFATLYFGNTSTQCCNAAITHSFFIRPPLSKTRKFPESRLGRHKVHALGHGFAVIGARWRRRVVPREIDVLHDKILQGERRAHTRNLSSPRSPPRL